jgi:hypothetical protein
MQVSKTDYVEPASRAAWPGWRSARTEHNTICDERDSLQITSLMRPTPGLGEHQDHAL